MWFIWSPYLRTNHTLSIPKHPTTASLPLVLHTSSTPVTFLSLPATPSPPVPRPRSYLSCSPIPIIILATASHLAPHPLFPPSPSIYHFPLTLSPLPLCSINIPSLLRHFSYILYLSTSPSHFLYLPSVTSHIPLPFPSQSTFPPLNDPSLVQLHSTGTHELQSTHHHAT